MKIKYLLILFVIVAGSFGFVVCSKNVSAASEAVTNFNQSAVKGFTGGNASGDQAAVNAKLAGAGVITDLSVGIGKVVGIGLSLLGTIFLVLIIFGGFTWMLARGNEQEVTKAKDLIQSAIIGLVIVLGAYYLVATIGYAIK